MNKIEFEISIRNYVNDGGLTSTWYGTLSYIDFMFKTYPELTYEINVN